MGRTSYSSRYTVEDCRCISVFFLREHGYLCSFVMGRIVWRNSFDEETGSIGIQVNLPSHIQLTYTVTNGITGKKCDMDYGVGMVSTRCHFGNERYWFRCHCGRRVAKLYFQPGWTQFVCRHCGSLTYESCRESHSMSYRFAKSFGLTLGQLKKGFLE